MNTFVITRDLSLKSVVKFQNNIMPIVNSLINIKSKLYKVVSVNWIPTAEDNNTFLILVEPTSN